jgi:hypothetical protein
MGTRLTHVAFDIETSGFETDARVTVVGFSLPLGSRVFLNTAGRSVDDERLAGRLTEDFGREIQVRVQPDEAALLDAVGAFLQETVAEREYLLVAYNGERFRGGFDLPFLRTRYALRDREWPFDGIPYADVLPLIQDRFNTTAEGEEHNDLVAAYETLIGGDLTRLDPFEESSEAVDAFERGDFEALLAHNVADVLRTDALSSLAEQFCGKAEFRLKSLTPSARDPDLSPPG